MLDRDSLQFRNNARRISDLFGRLARNYGFGGQVSDYTLYSPVEEDIHAFYTLQGKSVTIHLQGYPGMSSEEGAMVMARTLDCAKLNEIRARGNVRVGSETEAVIRIFPNFGNTGTFIPYDVRTLENMLAEEVPELRRGQ